jgi:hypothetical protein
MSIAGANENLSSPSEKVGLNGPTQISDHTARTGSRSQFPGTLESIWNQCQMDVDSGLTRPEADGNEMGVSFGYEKKK